jgi:membrane protein implicated in regulation of membrane protease activity
LSVRASPMSRTAAILIIAIGVFVLFTGVLADVFASEVEGIAFIILGVALYGLLLRFTKKLQREISEKAD